MNKKHVLKLFKQIIKKIFKPNTGLSFVNVIGEGTISARYCYAVFLRHIIHLNHYGMNKVPGKVAEIGPGNSIGTGLCFILTGADKYYGFDSVAHANLETNLFVFDELVELFRKREPIPKEFPDVKPYLDKKDNSLFPEHIFSHELLKRTLSDDRISLIRDILRNKAVDSNIEIKYISPWENYKGQYPAVKLVYSQAVLEHIDDLENFYKRCAEILPGGGLMSHQIDFRSHGSSVKWNVHWAIDENEWNSKVQGLPFYINREPLSTHIKLLKKNNFEIVIIKPVKNDNKRSDGINRKKLQGRFSMLSEEDFTTSGCYIISKKV